MHFYHPFLRSVLKGGKCLWPKPYIEKDCEEGEKLNEKWTEGRGSMAVNDEVYMYLTASTLGHEVGAKQECIPTRPQLWRGPGTPSDRPIHSLNGSFGKPNSLTATSQHSSPERTRRWDLQSLATIGMVPTPVPEHSRDRQGDLKFKVRLSYTVRSYLKNMRRNKIKWRPWQGISPVRLWFLSIAALISGLPTALWLSPEAWGF